MKLRFEPDLPHQRAAIDAVLDVLRGQALVTLAQAFEAGREHGAVANRLTVASDRLLADLRSVQSAAGLPLTELGDPPQLTVEMETGTGKTYVYLRTLLELSRRHGLRKLVVVVPSVAIREGVLKTLRITREHFVALLPGLDYDFFAYDGARLDRLRSFSTSSRVELMVVTLDAFNKSRNRMRQPQDAFGGRAPLELLRAARPVVVLDEPQRMESALSRAALADLHPLLVLRYSATHRTRHALVHRLTPRQAHARGLVKRIEVAAPASGLEDREARMAAQIRATVELHLRRQGALLERGIKVLSLLFLERVDDWVAEDGVARHWFRRAFEELAPKSPWMAGRTPDEVSAAYFAERRKGGMRRAVDSKTGRSAADEDAYALIMRDKERLLSLDEPVAFVVSHSALREGWDNPNVFQICTLAASRSAVKKRQEIGRGVRLCVDQEGRRVRDPEVDVLTVVTNDSYEAYVAGLQSEDSEAVGEAEVAPRPERASERLVGTTVAPRGLGPQAPWVTLDADRLRCVAVERVTAGELVTAGEPSSEAAVVPDAVAAVRELLLRRRPPCLVSTATIEVVLGALGRSTTTWAHAERVARAIEAALDEQVAGAVPPPTEAS